MYIHNNVHIDTEQTVFKSNSKRQWKSGPGSRGIFFMYKDGIKKMRKKINEKGRKSDEQPFLREKVFSFFLTLSLLKRNYWLEKDITQEQFNALHIHTNTYCICMYVYTTKKK